MMAARPLGGWLLRLLLAAALLLAPQWAAADVAVPPLKARVTDLTGTLDANQKATLEQTLAAFEARKGAQIAVLILPTTQPESVEQYAVRVEEAWKLGRKDVDDGVLLLIAKDDRKLRIEVGYGLEGVLPDAIAKRIIADDIAPHFTQSDFYHGIEAGITRIIGIIDPESLKTSAAVPAALMTREKALEMFAEQNRRNDQRAWWGFAALLAVLIGLFLRWWFSPERHYSEWSEAKHDRGPDDDGGIDSDSSPGQSGGYRGGGGSSGGGGASGRW